MILINKEKGYFCIAASDFETSKEVYVKEISFNEDFAIRLENAMEFWKLGIYPFLKIVFNTCKKFLCISFHSV